MIMLCYKKKTDTISHIAHRFVFVPQNLEDCICFHLQPEMVEFCSVGPV